MRDVELGQAMEDMLQTDGWKHLDGWLEKHENQAINDLKNKKFNDLSEVKALQVKIAVFKEMRGEINHRIMMGKEAQAKQE